MIEVTAIAALLLAAAPDAASRVEDLRSPDPEVRDVAARALIEAGISVLPALEAALDRTDDEAYRSSLRWVIEQIRTLDRYAFDNPETVMTWTYVSMAYRGRRATVRVFADGRVELSAFPRTPHARDNSTREERFTIREETLADLKRLFVSVGFLDVEPAEPPIEMVEGGVTWSLSLQPAGCEAVTYVSRPGGPDDPPDFDPILNLFEDIVERTDAHRPE